MTSPLSPLQELLTAFPAIREPAELLRGLQAMTDGLARSVTALGLDVGGLEGLLQATAVSPSTSLLQTYPREGNKRAMPAGQTVFDLQKGQVLRSDATSEAMSIGLAQYGFPYALSGLIWADSELAVTLYAEQVSTGRVFLPQNSFLPFESLPVDRIILDAERPYDLTLLTSTLSQAPVKPAGFASDQERFTSHTTTDTPFTVVPFSPTGGTLLAAAYRDGTLIVRNMGVKTFMITNSGDNSADLNIQFQEADGENWVDDSGTTGASDTLGSGNTNIYQTGINVRAIRLRARSTTPGSATTLRCTFRAIPQLR